MTTKSSYEKQPLAMILRETAEAAHERWGELPRSWTHYIVARRGFSSDAALARALGVSPSRVARWKQGETPEPENEAGIRDLAIVISLLAGYLEEEAIPDWLHGVNAHLAHSRPLDIVRAGRLWEVVRAIDAEKSGAFA